MHRGKNPYNHSLWEVVGHSRSKMHYTCLIMVHDPDMRTCRPRIKLGTFGLADECCTTELTLLLMSVYCNCTVSELCYFTVSNVDIKDSHTNDFLNRHIN